MKKYDQKYLDRNNLTQQWYDEQFKWMAEAIINCKFSCLKCVITDYTVFEAILPALFSYPFQLSKPDDLGYMELTIYLK